MVNIGNEVKKIPDLEKGLEEVTGSQKVTKPKTQR